MIELIRLIIELTHLILFFIEKIKNKNKNNNNRRPQQVTVIIIIKR
jgi:hypothetical protein